MTDKSKAFEENIRSVRLQPAMPLFADDWNDLEAIFRKQNQFLLKSLSSDGILEIPNKTTAQTNGAIIINGGRLALAETVLAWQGHMVFLSSEKYIQDKIAELSQRQPRINFENGVHLFGVFINVKIDEKKHGEQIENYPSSERTQLTLDFKIRYLGKTNDIKKTKWSKLKKSFEPFWDGESFRSIREGENSVDIVMGVIHMKFDDGWETIKIATFVDDSFLEQVPPKATIKKDNGNAITKTYTTGADKFNEIKWNLRNQANTSSVFWELHVSAIDSSDKEKFYSCKFYGSYRVNDNKVVGSRVDGKAFESENLALQVYHKNEKAFLRLKFGTLVNNITADLRVTSSDYSCVAEEDILFTPSLKSNNILAAENMDIFHFDASHKDAVGFAGSLKHVSDEVDRRSTANWKQHGFQQIIGSGAEASWQVDLLNPYKVKYIVVVGYPNGQHYPKDWWLSGSKNGTEWERIHDFPSSPDGVKPPPDWHFPSGSHNDGKSWNDVKDKSQGQWVEIRTPGFYQYYSITGKGWDISNKAMVLMNVGLFED